MMVLITLAAIWVAVFTGKAKDRYPSFLSRPLTKRLTVHYKVTKNEILSRMPRMITKAVKKKPAVRRNLVIIEQIVVNDISARKSGNMLLEVALKSYFISFPNI